MPAGLADRARRPRPYAGRERAMWATKGGDQTVTPSLMRAASYRAATASISTSISGLAKPLMPTVDRAGGSLAK